jgi:asparagine synthase (glutamine-hydrolysing)
MCGLSVTVVDTVICTESYVKDIVDNVSKLLEHRGPDNVNNVVINTGIKTIIMIHTRLHIIGDSTPQPLNDTEKSISLIINGEIFNWKELSTELNYKCSKSDCEILIPLYKKYIRENNDFDTFFKKLNGQFSFILYDHLTNYIFVSRDHIGITPLYYGYDETKVSFCSEMKGLTMRTNNDKVSFVSSVKTFYPRSYIYNHIEDCHTAAVLNGGHVLLNKTKKYLDYYSLTNENTAENTYENIEMIHTFVKRNIKDKLENSIKLQLNDIKDSDLLDYGVLLSGGLDSSLVASIISKLTDKKIKTFSIGMSKNSSDLIASRKVAKFLNSEHYEFYFTAQEGIDNLENVIWYTETYDTTTIRAGTAMYLLTKKIKEKFPKLKVLFSGELSDEMLSYLYGANAPTENDFQLETVKLVSEVHLFDCLRANKTCMANSIEVRVPFTDPDFVEYMLKLPVNFKTFGKLSNNTRMEKQILRDSFDILDTNGKRYLPREILFRKKEAYSDGVSNHLDIKENWIESIITFCNNKYGEIAFHIKKEKYNHNKPHTKEELYYRETFCKLFNKNSFTNTSELTVKFWAPKWCGDGYVDPSARKHIKSQFDIGSFEQI